MESVTTPTAAASAPEPPLWVALILRMGGDLVITTPPEERVPVYGYDAAGRLSVEMTESLEAEKDCRDMRVLCGVYFSRFIHTGDLSHHFLRHESLSNHPEAVGIFVPGNYSTGFAETTVEA